MSRRLQLQEIDGKKYLVYPFRSIREVDDIILQLLNESEQEGFMESSIRKAQKVVAYNIDGRISLADMPDRILPRSQFISVLQDLLDMLIYLEDSFIGPEYIAFESDEVYIDPETCKLYLAILPIQNPSSGSSLQNCVLDLISKFTSGESDPFTADAIMRTTSGMSKISDLQNLIRHLQDIVDIEAPAPAADEMAEETVPATDEMAEEMVPAADDMTEETVPAEAAEETSPEEAVETVQEAAEEPAAEEAVPAAAEAEQEPAAEAAIVEIAEEPAAEAAIVEMAEEPAAEAAEETAQEAVKEPADDFIKELVSENAPGPDSVPIFEKAIEIDDIPAIEEVPDNTLIFNKEMKSDLAAALSAAEAQTAGMTAIEAADLFAESVQEPAEESVEELPQEAVEEGAKELPQEAGEASAEELLQEAADVSAEELPQEAVEVQEEEITDKILVSELEEQLSKSEMPEAERTPAYLFRKKTSELIPLTGVPFLLGKIPAACDYQITDNPAVSRVHAVIRYAEEEKFYYIVDCGTTNNTYLNGKKIVKGKGVRLYDKDRLHLATEEFVFNQQN